MRGGWAFQQWGADGSSVCSENAEVALNQQVKDLIQKLGEAIHESVSESDNISGVVREIREQGFDVMLMLEATIGLNQVETEDEDADEVGTNADEATDGPFTRHDLTFLKSLRITTEESDVRGDQGTEDKR
jgi:uncharacterized protein (UPF0335 family)